MDTAGFGRDTTDQQRPALPGLRSERRLGLDCGLDHRNDRHFGGYAVGNPDKPRLILGGRVRPSLRFYINNSFFSPFGTSSGR